RISSKYGCLSKCSTLPRVPVKKLSMQMTFAPCSSRRSHRCEPRKPAPPVTRIRFWMCISEALQDTSINFGDSFVLFEEPDCLAEAPPSLGRTIPPVNAATPTLPCLFREPPDRQAHVRANVSRRRDDLGTGRLRGVPKERREPATPDR